MRSGGNSIRCFSPAENTYELAMDELTFDVLGKICVRIIVEFEGESGTFLILLQKSLFMETWLLMRKFSFSTLIELLVALSSTND